MRISHAASGGHSSRPVRDSRSARHRRDGEVYRAVDTKLKRDVAIKLLPDAFARDAERMKRFEREAQLLASLNHPNIATLYGLEETDGRSCLVMELRDGHRRPRRGRQERTRFWTLLPDGTPRPVRNVLRRCLKKDAKDCCAMREMHAFFWKTKTSF